MRMAGHLGNAPTPHPSPTESALTQLHNPTSTSAIYRSFSSIRSASKIDPTFPLVRGVSACTTHAFSERPPTKRAAGCTRTLGGVPPIVSRASRDAGDLKFPHYTEKTLPTRRLDTLLTEVCSRPQRPPAFSTAPGKVLPESSKHRQGIGSQTDMMSAKREARPCNDSANCAHLLEARRRGSAQTRDLRQFPPSHARGFKRRVIGMKNFGNTCYW